MNKGSRCILIMPAGRFQIPAIETAKAMGLKTVAIDRNPNAIGAAYADHFEPVDPSDTAAAQAVAHRHGVCGVASLASDPAVIPCAEIAHALGLPGLDPEVACLARDKRLSRERLRARLPEYVPRFAVLPGGKATPEVLAEAPFPAVVKPVDSNGSKGVMVVDGPGSLESACAYAMRYGGGRELLFEERMHGREVSVEALCTGHDVMICAITDKLTTTGRFCVETGHTIPSDLDPESQIALHTATRRIAEALGLHDCAIHAEFMVDNGAPRLVELGARLGGGCITSHLVPLATGIDMVRASIQMAIGETPALETGKGHGAAALRFFQPQPGVILSIEGVEEALACPGVVEVCIEVKRGDEILALENSDQRIGYVIAVGGVREEAVARVEDALGRVKIVTWEP